MRPLLTTFLLVCLCACGDGRWAPGYIVTEDGTMLSNNDENVRATTVHTIVSELDRQLGAHWRVEVAIAELPVYDNSGSDGDRSHTATWLWPQATVAVTLLGDGTVAPPISEAEITAGVRDYLYNRVDKANRNLRVTTTRVVDAARFAAKPAPANAAPAAAAPAATAPVAAPAATAPAPAAASVARTYTLQAGDTWADLSQAFYGSPQHWRRIAEANPGEPTPGRVVTIPPKP